MKKNAYLIFTVFIIAFLFQAMITHDRVFMAGNDASRFAQIESLIDYGVPYINESRYHWTVDRVTIEGKDYSNKPPVLSIFGAGVYFIFSRLFGITFARNEALVVYILTLTIIGGATAWLVASFFSSLENYEGISFPARIITTTALATGTILTSYSTTFNNHVIAAALLFSACRAGWTGYRARAGFLVALTTSVDLVPGIVFTPVLALIIFSRKHKKMLLNYFLPFFLGAMIFIAANWFIVHSPFPPKMVPGALEHGSGTVVPGDGSVRINVPFNWLPSDWSIPLQGLLGWRGFFSLSPVLLFGLYGLLKNVRSGRVLTRETTFLMGAGCIILITGHILMLASFGGWSYGYRYFIPVIPILLFYVPVVLNRFRIKLFSIILVPSILCAWIGAYNPWPPVHEPEARKEAPFLSAVTSPFGANLTALLQEHMNGSVLAEKLGRVFIHPDQEMRERYYYLFFKSKGDEAMAEKYYDLIIQRHRDRHPAGESHRPKTPK